MACASLTLVRFMKSEAEEKLQIQKLQQRNVSACLPPLALDKLDAHRPSSTVVSQCTVLKEHVEIMEGLLGPAHSATLEPDGKHEEEENEQRQEEIGMYPDVGLLSYTDKLCYRKHLLPRTDRGESGRAVRSCVQGLRPPLAQPRPAARPTLRDPAFPATAARLGEGDPLQLTPEAVRGRQFARPRALSQEAVRMPTPMLGPDMTMNPGASMFPFAALPFPRYTPRVPHRTPWERHPLPLMTSPCPPGIPLGLSAFPRTLLVPSVGDSGPSGARSGKVIVQVRTEGRSAELPGIQTFVMVQNPLNWSTPGAASGALEHAPPPLGEASAVIPDTSVVGTQAYRGVWSPTLSLQAPPPAAQLASIFPQVKACSGQHASSGKESLAATQSRPSLDDASCNPQSVYQNYRRWQCFKSLARRHHPQSPDTEALSCFLIPVLRSLARLKPTMTLEEGLWQSVQEWQRKSNFDRMIFYEMAQKFMEFEAEEELEIQMLQQRNASVCLLPLAPRNLDPHGPSSTMVGQHPVFIPKKGGSMAQPPKQHQHRPQHPWEPKRSHEIPPEAVKEYVEIMEDLLGTAHSATVEPDRKCEEEANEEQEEENELYPDPGLLSYIDNLCAQEAFITKVEAVIHPQFLEMLLSPDSQVDPMSLRQELEEEEGLTLTQLVEKRLLELKGKVGVEAPPTYAFCTMEFGVPGENPSPEL
ncbi:NUT family member 2D-like [Elephas maximus indicus]|uniref:NUT family member 2D-like n=1 Tax=Elephas maximus indicus TaxID=99487 RepID=UPI00211657F1|nr:NUT family member 2D-like [Elephas maximus indicus]